AFETLERDPPDVVLLDVAGLAQNGMEVLDRIRASPQLASTPVVIVTSRCGDDDVLAGYKFGADYYLTKPVTARRLLRGIGLVLCDRFSDSTVAYQGYGRGLSLDVVRELDARARDGLAPALTFLLDCPVETGLARAKARAADADRFERETVAFHARIRAGFD